jgi:isopentenyl phosphate kinase
MKMTTMMKARAKMKTTTTTKRLVHGAGSLGH